MKTIKSIAPLKYITMILTLCVFFSCTTNDSDESLEDLDVRSEIQHLSIYRLAMEFKNTSYDLSLPEDTRDQLRRVSEMIFKDLELVESFREDDSKASNRDPGGCPQASICWPQYEGCISWAVHWDNLLAQCNGPNPPSNCDQVRADYLANLDEIEQTYISCSQAYNTCASSYCGSGEPMGPLL